LLEKIGVDVEVYKTAPAADADSVFRPYTPAERKRLERNVESYYQLFLERVAQGRGLEEKAVKQAAGGKVWTGRQALARGLVDELGGLRQAIAHARKLAGLGSDSPILEVPPPGGSLLGRVLGVEGRVDSQASTMPQPIAEIVRGLAPFVIHPSNQALMRLPFSITAE